MMRVALLAGMLLVTAMPLNAQETISRGKNLSVDIARDGRLAIGLVGDIWIVPPGGGEARALTHRAKSASRPRWSPDSLRIAYQLNTDGASGIWDYNIAEKHAENLSSENSFDIHPDWHPDQQRLVYARDKTGKGFDLWELDLPTGLRWRLTHREGDETEPAWSADGRDLVYVHSLEDRWSIILRRHGQPEEVLLTTTDTLAAPAWRPDGSLITYLRDDGTATMLEMAILSNPRLVRTYAGDEKFDRQGVSWLDRHRMIYAVDGRIRQRLFNSWSSSPLLFRATLQSPAITKPAAIARRQLPRVDEPPGRLVIHAARLYDGLGSNYQSGRDIIIEGGWIVAVEPHRDRPGSVVIDMGDLTVVPGYVDARAELPQGVDDELGAMLLTTGVTTLIANGSDIERLNERWSGKERPGPRLFTEDGRLDDDVSALADSMTPGLNGLLQSRQARLIGRPAYLKRRFAERPSIEVGASSMILASRDNDLQPGLALHAELRALTAAGLEPAQALRAAGVNAAAAQGLDPYVGRIAVGSVADLVFIDGDPLNHIDDALNIVAVVRNGRFFSVAGLIERVETQVGVE